uniref:Uncharacterized protein n=2 Tax=Meloidogyne TaxID=189290 RepID=A0A6V7U446_MELEN|nr:unnamed protein product [Meloidogyne enterolobii]CAD2202318.1 unnamed protein product [Meloidogyne enterolobii]
MEPILFASPKHFVNGHVVKVGLKNNELFVAYRDKTLLEVWSVNCYIPSSWQQLFKQEYHDLFYAKCTLSIEQNAIFVLVAAFFGRDGGVCILRYNLDNHLLEEFSLDSEEAYKFEEVTLERVGLGCGHKERQLFLYDRTMVTGQIPFWNIYLNEEKMTFSVNSLPILDEENICENCTRFPVVINGDKRRALRISNDYKVFIYNSDSESWELFNVDDGKSGLDLSYFAVRGLNETFGRNWHRITVIESKLSIFVDGDFCFFKVLRNGEHFFFKFTISIKECTYRLENCGCISLDKRLETLCFLSCSKLKIAFVNKHIVGFVAIQPPELREICFWAIQKEYFVKRTCDNLWKGGKTEKELRKILSINSNLKLID